MSDEWNTVTEKKGKALNTNTVNARPSHEAPTAGAAIAKRQNSNFSNTRYGEAPRKMGARPGNILGSTPGAVTPRPQNSFGGGASTRSFIRTNSSARDPRDNRETATRFKDLANSSPKNTDYFADTDAAVAEALPADETVTDTEYSIDSMKAIARLVVRYRSTITFPDCLSKFNTDGGSTTRKMRGGNNDFSRGQKFGEEGVPEGNNDPFSSGFSRGAKTYSVGSFANTPNSGRRGGRGRYQEEECDPDLVIERIDVKKLLSGAEAVETPETPDAASPVEELEEGGEENFVRRQARRKAGEDNDAKVIRKLRGHLNKLTDANYASILAKTVSDEGICTREQLDIFVGLVFEKASQMEAFLSVYAKLMIDIREDMIKKGVVSAEKEFKSLVLNAAEASFESLVYAPWEPSADIDADDQFNAIVLRKNERRGLANFMTRLCLSRILSKKIVEKLVDTLLERGSGTIEQPTAINTTLMEMILHIFTAIKVAYEEDSQNKTAQKCIDILKDKIPSICAIINRTETELLPPTRIKFLLEDMVEAWEQF